MGVIRPAARRAALPVWLLLALALAGLGCQPAAEVELPPDLSAYPWLYLRAGQPVAAGDDLVEVLAVGDIMLGRGVSAEPDPLGLASPWLSAADLAVGNFEGVFAGSPAEGQAALGNPETGPYPLLVPPEAAGLLHEAGVDLLGLANNHTLDQGPAGLARTAALLESGDLQPFGAGPDPGTAWAPVFKQVGKLRLAFLACNAVPIDPWVQPARGPALCEPARAAKAIGSARSLADGVILLVHWGYEYDQRVDPAQRALAAALIGFGADLVVGHHPHTVQGTQVFGQQGDKPGGREGFVAYSLGNFVFDQGDDRAQEGLALRALFDREGLRAVQALPVWAGLQPRLMDEEDAAARLVEIAPLPLLIRFVCDPEGCQPAPELAEPHTGLFWSGEIDLTGDGQPEQVRRVGQQAVIYEGADPVWESPPEWQVLDLALGDPNDDGRGEVLLALLKPDPAGDLRSHPFIIGYRGGRYRQLWGGSAVSGLIREVELGDVDGDGVQELVVLEDQGEAGLTALSVWRWNGWGFTLVWRSETGNYQNLALVDRQKDRPGMIQVERSYAHR